VDGDRFDTLAKRLSTPTSRRATVGAAVTGGFLSALGLTRSIPEASAAQGGTCVVAFAAQVRQGPSTQQPLIPGGRAGEIRGDLSFSISRSGSLDNATLTLADGTSLPVVGDAAGHSVQLRIALGPKQALVAVGVGEQEIAQCLGAIDGVTTGPQSGDLGDWHAAAGVQNVPRGGQSSTGAAQGSAGTSAGAGSGRTGRAGRSDRGATGAAGAGEAGNAGQGHAEGTGQDPSCPPGETYCAYVEECRDLQTSPLDCGACGTRCPSLVCQEGRCLSEDEADQLGALELQCTEGFTLCPNVEDPSHPACFDLLTDALNCGACGNVCPVNNCSEGVCGGGGIQNCAPPFAVCGDACVDTSSDPLNCGACGIACGAGETCQQGACAASTTNAPALVCDAGLTDCGGTCVDLQTNDFHCGGCMLGCAGDQTCQGGTCVANAPVCDAGLTDCGGGTCVDLQNDPNNCGACGTICPSGQCGLSTCVESVGPAPGVVPCPEGQTMCGDTCVDLNSDLFNCAVCGKSCNVGKSPSCQGGVCYNGGVCPDNPGGAC
jgi:hypothetical protein